MQTLSFEHFFIPAAFSRTPSQRTKPCCARERRCIHSWQNLLYVRKIPSGISGSHLCSPLPGEANQGSQFQPSITKLWLPEDSVAQLHGGSYFELNISFSAGVREVSGWGNPEPGSPDWMRPQKCQRLNKKAPNLQKGQECRAANSFPQIHFLHDLEEIIRLFWVSFASWASEEGWLRVTGVKSSVRAAVPATLHGYFCEVTSFLSQDFFLFSLNFLNNHSFQNTFF